MRKTKIIATIGPSTWIPERIKALVNEGVNAFRINFSHGNEEVWSKTIKLIREENSSTPIIGDLKGPVIRIGKLKTFEVKKGDKVKFKMMNESTEKGVIPINEPLVFKFVREGDIILIESGKLAFRVDSVSDDTLESFSLRDGIVSSEKTFAVKGKELPLPPLTNYDLNAIKFAVKNDIDFIALSFVKDKEDVIRLKQLLRDLRAEEIKVIAKIETKKAVDNLNEIARVADAILVARGDLAIYFELEEMPQIQRKIIYTTRKLGKPVIIATQLLDSMVHSPLPSRSEIVDIYTAVKEGVDAMLLADETAIGNYPLESVIWLSRTIESAEAFLKDTFESPVENTYEAVAKAAVIISNLLSAKIIAYSERGNTARRLAMYRPKNETYIFSYDIRTVRQMNILWGILPILGTFKKQDTSLLTKMISLAKKKGLLVYGDIAVLTAGVREGSTDVIHVERIT